MASMRCVVSGRVQGVSFRAFTRQKARELGLAGWVRNRADGSVELVAQGAAAELDKLKLVLAEGPMLARVDELRCETLDSGNQGIEGFDIRF